MKYYIQKNNFPLLLAMLLVLACQAQKKGNFSIEALGKTYALDNEKLINGLFYHLEKDQVTGGNTSIRNVDENHLEWKGNPKENGFGYFQRNRDLGQVFQVPAENDVVIDALVLRTSRGNNALMKGAVGSRLRVVFFEVDIPANKLLKINENGTTKGERATHGFDHQFNRADDFIEGVEYTFLKQFIGGIFPEIPFTDQYVYDRGRGESFGEQPGHLVFFKCDFDEKDEITLKAGRKYAFIIGFESPGIDRGLALAINTEVHTKEAAQFVKDELGAVRWGIRREGNGALPPKMVSMNEPPKKGILLNQLLKESMFPKNHFSTLKPTTDGYPDVDTYRTLQFYLEVRK
ncbi:hypothetical protein [Maribacter hydrothermalis]|uniref:Uncharacterized protein n=1 Tax=Maribacter hydrothermalis TaxID=1836467 RepID=A0A1B7ZC72_9FLAO|nr:hypothetical protein [Maribacter hydrothermalis]APQ15946.1 hypothetical protein BTR34_00685 [Maribacter hydrothermalis]OBR40363.1 hypothetical protein A9200_15890 [Maribacter hydrothermalis]